MDIHQFKPAKVDTIKNTLGIQSGSVIDHLVYFTVHAVIHPVLKGSKWSRDKTLTFADHVDPEI